MEQLIAEIAQNPGRASMLFALAAVALVICVPYYGRLLLPMFRGASSIFTDDFGWQPITHERFDEIINHGGSCPYTHRRIDVRTKRDKQTGEIVYLAHEPALVVPFVSLTDIAYLRGVRT